MEQTDIAVVFDLAAGRMDLSTFAGDLDTANPLEIAVWMSLGTDARADEADGLEPGEDPRGWFGDSFAEIPGDQTGVRWWRRRREVITDELVKWIGDEGTRALSWMTDDAVRLAKSATVTAYRDKSRRNGIAVIAKTVEPDGGLMDMDVTNMWEALRNE